MNKLTIYDPPMCCSTGVCGPTVDPILPRFAADLEWLKSQGVVVERFNLGLQPQEFVANPVVSSCLRERGNDCLPLFLINGQFASCGSYPGRSELTVMLQLEESVTASCCSAATDNQEGCCTPKSTVGIGISGKQTGSCC